MPKEYYKHVHILEDQSIDGMAKALKEILSKDRSELYDFGQNTKKWMLANKNSKTQIQKLIDFTDNNFR